MAVNDVERKAILARKLTVVSGCKGLGIRMGQSAKILSFDEAVAGCSGARVRVSFGGAEPVTMWVRAASFMKNDEFNLSYGSTDRQIRLGAA